MTKFYTMLAGVLLVASSGQAGRQDKHHVDEGCQKCCVPTLRVKKDASVGGTLRADDVCADKARIDDVCVKNLRAEDAWVNKLNVRDIHVKCCEKRDGLNQDCATVVVTCEKCLNDIRGVVRVFLNVSPEGFNPNGVTPALAQVISGCGYSVMPESAQVNSIDITTQYRRIGQILPFNSAARNAIVSVRLCLDKPCCDRLAVASTIENEFPVNNQFTNVVSPSVFDLSGLENIFAPGTFYPINTFVAIEAAEVIINQVNESCFTLNWVLSFVASSCETTNNELLNNAISQVQLACLSTGVNPQADGVTFNFIEQCPIRCNPCEDKHEKHDKCNDKCDKHEKHSKHDKRDVCE